VAYTKESGRRCGPLPGRRRGGGGVTKWGGPSNVEKNKKNHQRGKLDQRPGGKSFGPLLTSQTEMQKDRIEGRVGTPLLGRKRLHPCEALGKKNEKKIGGKNQETTWGKKTTTYLKVWVSYRDRQGGKAITKDHERL